MKTTVLNIDQFENSKVLNNVYVNMFSNHIRLNQDLINKPHSHNFYLCVLFTEGTGTHEIDFNSYSINPGKVFFLKPGQTHFWKFDTKPKGYIFFHSQEFYEMTFVNHRLKNFPFYYSYQNPPVIELRSNDIDFQKKFKNLYQEYLKSEVFRNLKIVNIINDIYIDLTREYTSDLDLSDNFNSRYLNILESFEHLLDQSYDKQKLPKYYADKLNISTKHLNRVVKQTINKTTNQMISERVILEAKRLIVHSNTSLSIISESLDFSDYAYFSKYFKTKTGITPMEFKRKYSI